ncbi:MAG: hypothetical protein WAT19_00885 [Ferruginibacter sp.]
MKKYLKIFILSIVLFLAKNSSAQVPEAVIANADTTMFSPNAAGDWQILNSYVSAQGTDSVLLEVLLYHPNNINWQEEHLVGNIKEPTGLRPSTERTVSFNLINTIYIMRVSSNGDCYLKFSTGDLPTANPVVLPARVIFSQ